MKLRRPPPDIILLEQYFGGSNESSFSAAALNIVYIKFPIAVKKKPTVLSLHRS